MDADSPSLCSRRRSGAELRESVAGSRNGFSASGKGFSPAKKRHSSSVGSGVVLGSPYWVEPGLAGPPAGQAMANVY